MLKAEDFFILSGSFPFRDSFNLSEPPWNWLSKLSTVLANYPFKEIDRAIPSGLHIQGPVYIDPSVELPAYGCIEGPCYIGKNTELRPGVYIRGNVLVGDACVLGNSCEFKNTIILDGAQIPHFSYVGDSILGNKAHLGAGVICSNLRLDQADVQVRSLNNERIDTGMRKLGAIVGDRVEVGCNAVLNPGSLLFPDSSVYPSLDFRGTLGPHTIACNQGGIRRIQIKKKL